MVGKGWTLAKNLVRGDWLYSEMLDDHVIVESISVDALKQNTYNFTVNGYHTFFVGSFSSWVHNNDCFDDNKQKKGKPERAVDQNRQYGNAAGDEGLTTKARREKLREEVERSPREDGENLSYHDIREIAKEIKNGIF